MKIQLKLLAISLLLSVNGLAQTDSKVKNDIIELARAIRLAAPESEASAQALVDVREQLNDALDTLEASSNIQNGCFKFAFDKYNTSNTTSNATDKAIAACKIIVDLGVAQFAFEKYNVSNTTSNAMDKAAEAAKKSSKGKLDMVTFGFEKYNVSNTTSNAMDLAVKGVASVPRGSLSCVKELFDKYNTSNITAEALNKAFAGCSQ